MLWIICFSIYRDIETKKQVVVEKNDVVFIFLYNEDFNLNVFYRETSGELGWAGALSNGLDLDSKEIGLNVTLEKFESRRFQVKL